MIHTCGLGYTSQLLFNIGGVLKKKVFPKKRDQKKGQSLFKKGRRTKTLNFGTDGRSGNRRTDGRRTDVRKKFRRKNSEKIWRGKARVTEIPGGRSPPDPPPGARHG